MHNLPASLKLYAVDNKFSKKLERFTSFKLGCRTPGGALTECPWSVASHGSLFGGVGSITEQGKVHFKISGHFHEILSVGKLQKEVIS